MTNTISWNLQLKLREGQLDKFRALAKEMINSTKAEERKTLIYEWFLSEDGTSCHINESYTDSAAVMTHLEAFGAKFAERILACVEPTSLTVYGEPSDEVRGVLDGFGAVYIKAFDGFRR